MANLRDAARALLEVLRPHWGDDDELDRATEALRSALKEADAPQGGGASEDRAVTAPDGSGSLTTRITALIAQFDESPEDLQDVARNFPESKALLAWLTKAASAPAQAGEAVACADCAAGHPRYFVPSNGETIHALPGGMVNFCAAPSRPGGAAQQALPASLLPLARALLRDADTALGNTGGMRVGLPKATVDANRLRNVASAVVAHLEAQRPGGAAQEPPLPRPFHDLWQNSETGRLLELPMHASSPGPHWSKVAAQEPPRAKSAEGGEGGA